ncbi:hypothetical protein BFW01_g5682 [Lasiodiplodia theobromae]|nr:hypothetical protein BFW01_g5682 [Lasiodiplodia theobromae]
MASSAKARQVEAKDDPTEAHKTVNDVGGDSEDPERFETELRLTTIHPSTRVAKRNSTVLETRVKMPPLSSFCACTMGTTVPQYVIPEVQVLLSSTPVTCFGTITEVEAT